MGSCLKLFSFSTDRNNSMELASLNVDEEEHIKIMESYRFVSMDGSAKEKYPSNKIVNTKYNILTFIPLVLFNQFKFFYNMFFLLITISQFFPPLQVGFLFTYVAPLAFVLLVTMLKEAVDDLTRWQRDKEINYQMYSKITTTGLTSIRASDMRVGDLIELKANERIPADMVLLWTSEESGTVFIRTDQLDGETDWKLRRAVAFTQDKTTSYAHEVHRLLSVVGKATVENPKKQIYEFSGNFEVLEEDKLIAEPLGLENTLWASTVLTMGRAIGLVIYSGKQTRSAMNSKTPSSKSGICDKELNFFSILLFWLMVVISLVLLFCAGITSNFYILFFRYLLLLSSIIPISLRVNLDMAKIWFSWLISHDNRIKGTIARNSNIPEELGRVQCLMTDKTGTLTQNEMLPKKIILPFGLFSKDDPESIEDLKGLIKATKSVKSSRNIENKRRIAKDMATALSLCHSVTPVRDENAETIYQASSPDEIALVKFADSLGVELVERKQDFIKISSYDGVKYFNILESFPFSSARKRMGIILENRSNHEIRFLLKGAEDVMKYRIAKQDVSKTLEDCQGLASEGLRTLVISQKVISRAEYEDWQKKYEEAKLSLEDRDQKMQCCVEMLESDLEVLGVTGVEDKLQRNVSQTIRKLKEAGISIWVLTGDKVETAECIAISTELKSKNEEFYRMVGITDEKILNDTINQFRRSGSGYVLVIDGTTLELMLKAFEKEFVEMTLNTPCVVCCRVSPTQKTQIVEAVKTHTKRRISSIGDGGNDVGMILASHVGIGIEGKEGKQASLAADFSVSEFQILQRLVLWHGRNSYKRTAKLANFVYHRGIIISVIQVIFTSLFVFCAIPIFNGYLMLGYATVYTTMPVFSLVLDEDTTYDKVIEHPKLYTTLLYGRELNFCKFAFMLLISIYQGCAIMFLEILIFPDNNFVNIVAITFSALIFTELFNIITEINRFHWGMGMSEVVTAVMYLLSVMTLKSYFDLDYIFSLGFILRVFVITFIAWFPVHLIKWISNKIDPPEEKKV